MGNSKTPLQAFDKFVLRTPLLPFQFYTGLTEKSEVSVDQLKEAFSQEIIKEAIFLASPTLYFELDKWQKDELEPKKEQRVILSLLKYLSRMSSRCTPFGLFAGCTIGSFAEKTQLALHNPSDYQRFTRPDMNYLVALSQDLAKKEHIKTQLCYFPNSSLYTVGNQLRYIEYYYAESRRHHHIVEIDNSHYLSKILQIATSGAKLEVLSNALVDDEISEEQALAFIDELLDSQVLTSNLEPSVSGPPFVNQMLNVLEPLQNCEAEIEFLKQISNRFNQLDSKLGNSPGQYLKLSQFLKQESTSFELKYLFQTDLEPNVESCTISKEHLKHIERALLLFNKLTPKVKENNLERFKKAFQERYEEREMPLCHVLDVETGIGYLQNTGNGDVNPLVDDLFIPQAENPFAEDELKLNTIHKKLLQKITKARDNNEHVISLEDADFEDFEANWTDTPSTLSIMTEFIQDGEQTKIVLSGGGGSSAANLLGRFCHEESTVTNYTKQIITKETELNFNKLIAEIVHLPEARVGNILMRPSFRGYEIPYLAKSILPEEQQLTLEDLFISVKGNRILLRSKKYNMEVLPRLTNAHNYAANSLPIYHFLSDLQTQGLRGAIGFNFGPLSGMFDFLPRVEYGNLIIHDATWRVQKKSIEPLITHKKDNERFAKEMLAFQKTRRLPKYVLLADGDNELLINLENRTSVQMLLETVKNRPSFTLKEFLHDKGELVTSKRGYFTNQVVVSFFNEEKHLQATQMKKEFYGAA
ncbi:lantibiotic dehydratase family protein [Croceivirga thetidis]|uniref:Lantibiotic dehydratase n=1 Tax=Croceivirga thetidis TaxID=2721623 RepID=A0ABX1GNX6_9FLAO|nr:lantibiotic dehydratase family protein [Croceivirga thetidis]NKI30791.1 lantibiotic dehydratase [Croceivirga thetidis]